MLYVSTKFCEIISNGIKVIERTRFLGRKLQRRIIPQKNVGGVTIVNLCTSSGHALYFYHFCEIILNGIKVIERTRFLVRKLPRVIIAKMYVERPLLISARRLVMLYISTKFCEIILSGIKVIERTRFLVRKVQWGIILPKM